jgi:trehalose 6-phosphate phosphatase
VLELQNICSVLPWWKREGDIMNSKEISKKKAGIDLDQYDAAIFDMDGVITNSARAHAAAWKKMFDEYLQELNKKGIHDHEPFDPEDDYYRYVDGKPRYEGTKSFLESRQITLPHGSPDDLPDKETVCGLGNRKNKYFMEHLEKYGVEYYQGAVDLVNKVQNNGIKVAVISSSRNAKKVLDAAGVRSLFPVIIDGVYMAENGLKGKPSPDIFLEAAKRLNISPDRAMVFEDAVSGIKAAKAGGFALVVGIDRTGKNRDLKKSGADMIVRDLSEIRRQIDE